MKREKPVFHIRQFLDFFYPGRCPVCGRILAKEESLVCRRCRAELPWVKEPVCVRCGKPIASLEKALCADCETMHSRKGVLPCYMRRVYGCLSTG